MSFELDIVMPYYGDVDLMKLAVSSVLAQTRRDWRLTVLDDCYPDEEPRHWFARLDDDRVRYIRHAENIGASRNYELASSLPSGSHVVFMGADDVMLPHYVETMAAAVARHPEAAVVHPHVQVIDETGAPVTALTDRTKRWLMPDLAEPGKDRVLVGEQAVTRLLHGNWAYFPSMMWNVGYVKAHHRNPDFDVVHDLALLVDVLMQGGEFVLVNEPVFEYRRHGGSMSSSTAFDGRRFQEEQAFFLAMAPQLRARGWDRAARAARLHFSSRLHAALVARQLAASGQRSEAGKLLRTHVLATSRRLRG